MPEVWIAAIHSEMSLHAAVFENEEEAREFAKMMAETGKRVLLWKAQEVK